MRATCFINCFNYRSYVGEAVRSALAQTRPFDQILVVDDGSSDGSLAALEQDFKGEPLVHLVGKQNGGQLSCFNFAIPRVAGDILFFLDADDRYCPTYLETALRCYERTETDFLVVGMENFGADDRCYASNIGERDLGYSVLTTLLAGTWIGGPTSCLSMKTSLAKRLLPCPFEKAWPIQADNVLVYGTSLLGARKYRLGQPLVQRRVHAGNLFYGRNSTPLKSMRLMIEKNRLFAWYVQLAGYNLADLPRLLPWEFRTLAQPSYKEYRRYVRLTWNSQLSLISRVKQIISLTRHALRPGRSRAIESTAARKFSPRVKAAA